MVLSYAVCGDMDTQSESSEGDGTTSSRETTKRTECKDGAKDGGGSKFLAAISLFVAAGTVCGPFIGAALSDSHHWVTIVPVLERRELTTAPALDFPSEHTHVRCTWSARI